MSVKDLLPDTKMFDGWAGSLNTEGLYCDTHGTPEYVISFNSLRNECPHCIIEHGQGVTQLRRVDPLVIAVMEAREHDRATG